MMLSLRSWTIRRTAVSEQSFARRVSAEMDGWDGLDWMMVLVRTCLARSPWTSLKWTAAEADRPPLARRARNQICMDWSGPAMTKCPSCFQNSCQTSGSMAACHRSALGPLPLRRRPESESRIRAATVFGERPPVIVMRVSSPRSPNRTPHPRPRLRVSSVHPVECRVFRRSAKFPGRFHPNRKLGVSVWAWRNRRCPDNRWADNAPVPTTVPSWSAICDRL